MPIYKFTHAEFEEHETVLFRLVYPTLRDVTSYGLKDDLFTEVMDQATKNTPKQSIMKQYLGHPIIAELWWGNPSKNAPGFINDSLVQKMLRDLTKTQLKEVENIFTNLAIARFPLPKIM